MKQSDSEKSVDSGKSETAGMGPEELLGMARGFFSSRIILSAAELGLFDRLPATAEVVAEDSGWDVEALRTALDALAAIGVIEKDGKAGPYRIVPSLKRALSRDPEVSVLPMIEHLDHLWNLWSDLGEIIRSGRKPKTKPSVLADPKRRRSFIGAMHAAGQSMAEELADELMTEPARKLLDVGGASGTYAAAFLARRPEMTATLFDLPEVIPMAEERLERRGLRDRVTLVSGNYNRDPLPGGHDRVWLSAIVHQNSREENRALYEKCFQALEPGGKLWIRDHVMDDARVNPPAGAVFAVNMLVATSGGDTFTLAEFQEDLESAGFVGVRVLRNGDRMDAVLEAVRP
ncbi:MAG: methyltransferase [Desulfococcaceae bacterium]